MTEHDGDTSRLVETGRLSWSRRRRHMLFKAMPAEVMAAWSHATIPDMDFQELSLTGAGPTWSIPHEGDASVRLRPFSSRAQPSPRGDTARVRSSAVALRGRVSDAHVDVGPRAVCPVSRSTCRFKKHRINPTNNEALGR